MINTLAESFSNFALNFGLTVDQAATLLAVIILWTIPWKGVALWKSAHREEKWWFIVLLVINTIGILEILYIFVFSRKNSQPVSVPR